MIRALLAIVLLVTAAMGWAQPDEERLHSLLRDADPEVRAAAERGLWAVWMRSGDAVIDADLERGTQLMQAGVLGEAIEVFDKSIADCLEVLKRKPRHFGALSGMGLLHARREDYAGALAWFRRALEVNST